MDFYVKPSEEDNNPESLYNCCLLFIAKYLQSIIKHRQSLNDYEWERQMSGFYDIFNGVAMPREICEQLLELYQQRGIVLDDDVLNLFSNPLSTKINRVRIRDANITDRGFDILLRHRLVELEVSRCYKLSENFLTNLNEFGDRLETLIIGPLTSPEILLEALLNCRSLNNLKNLRRLALRNYRVLVFENNMPIGTYFHQILEPLNLFFLDLSEWFGISDLSFLTNQPNLVSLTLHNIPLDESALNYICQLKKIRHLDISQSNDKYAKLFDNENEVLSKIVESLPVLQSLDISGTNLAGTGVAVYKVKGHGAIKTDIPGLISRADRPLEFLGLYGTLHGACRRHDIPAKLISGDGNESQILTAAATYIERLDVLQSVLNDLYHLLRYETCNRIPQALDIILDAMDRHLSQKHIQISCSASLFYVVKNKTKPEISKRLKRKIITTLLNGMNEHKDDDTMMRNGCLTLCQFKIPQDVLFEYRRLILTLLHIVSEMEQEGFVQRIGIYLLNSLACQVDGVQKEVLGDWGAIKIMLKLIADRIKRATCDDVLEVAWSTMWNVTDETPINCERFLDGGGMELFLECLSIFPDKDELMRNMMGLLGNVAEVQYLRPRLMTEKYVPVFSKLVTSTSDGIEVSYNAAGVLSHIASDGEEAWTIEYPTREEVLRKMVCAIESWSILSERNINYRSFEPILKLAKVRHTPECQHWAVWALANLTAVYPEKYCLLFEMEGGLPLLHEIIQDDAPYKRIKELALMVINRCQKYRDMAEERSGPPQLDG